MKIAALLISAAALWAQQERVLLPPPTVAGQEAGVGDSKAQLDWRIKPEAKAQSNKKNAYSYKVVTEELKLANTDLSLGLKSPPPPALTLPERRTRKLANGLTVHLYENRELPRWQAMLLAAGGSLADPPEKVGLASLAMTTLREGGAKKKSGEELVRSIEQAGGVITTEAGPRHSMIQVRTLTESGPAALEALRDLAVDPDYDMGAVDTALGRYRAMVANRNRRPGEAANREFTRAIYGPATPQGRLIEFQTLDNIDRQDLVNFHRRTFAPENSVLIVEGDFAAADLDARIDALFSGWTGKSTARPAPAAVQAVTTPGIRYIEARDTRRSTFVLGHMGGTVKDPDYAALLLLAEILGGNGSGRLHKLAQSQQRWEATFNVAWQAEIDPGVFRITGAVAPWSTTDAMAAVLGEIDRLATQPPTDREFEEARNRLLGLAATRYSRPFHTLVEMSVGESFGMPPATISNTYAQIARLDRATLAAVAKKRMRSADCIAVVAGSDTLFDKPLASLNRKVIPLDITPPPPKPAEPRTDPESVAAGKAFIERMRKALGGEERLSKVHQWALRYEGKMWLGANPIDSKRQDRWIEGDVFRQDVETTTSISTVFYNGTIGWISDRRGLAPLSIPLQKQVQGELFRLMFRLATSDRDAKRSVSHLGSNIVSIAGPDGQAVRIFFDEETGLPQRLTYWTVDAASTTISIEENLLDWKDFDGLKLPGRVIVKQNGARFEDTRLMEAKFSGLDVKELEKKP
ncbi:MAG: pitrilysin family protein [Bryobacteraceae bacterium]